MKQDNMAMLCDFYEFTMASGYFDSGYYKKNTYFDLFFRNIPDKGGFAISCGLESFVNYIENFKFTEEDIEYLKSKKMFKDDFLDHIRKIRFTGDIYAVPEGTPIFPNEPMLIVRAPAIEAQLIETFALLTFNHQSLIATKASRIVRAAGKRGVIEFGARRAHGTDAAVNGARAAYIAGCIGTSCSLTDEKYNVPAMGTMAHSWVQMFESEYEAFARYCEAYPSNTTLLVDTYDTLKSGVPNAIKAFKEILVPKGIDDFSIRLDSGDIAYLSKKARTMLDEAGLNNCKIFASNSLDEHLITDLILQGAEVDLFGVGECLITSKSSPVFGGVYKLVAIEHDDGYVHPKIKISDNVDKITNPHFKKVYRLFDKVSKKAMADQVCVYDEVINELEPLTIFDPNAVWKQKTLSDFSAKELLVPIFKNGVRVYDMPSIDEIRNYCEKQISLLWDEVKRFENPHKYYVDLSKKLWDIKQGLLNSSRSM